MPFFVQYYIGLALCSTVLGSDACRALTNRLYDEPTLRRSVSIDVINIVERPRYHSFWRRFGTLEIPFTPLCQCLSEETLKAVGPLFLVSMPGGVNEPCHGLHNSERRKIENKRYI